tara:strand:+ start:371 stop:778 length:408 start_codon:yes stop_codon:yes gene_type:complete
MSQIIKTKFSIQIHNQKKRKNRSHWDIRILSPRKLKLWSWAIPKSHFPERGEKVLAVRTSDHKVSYLMFEGTLKNGDKVSLYDYGECDLIITKRSNLVIRFKGKKVKEVFTFVKTQGNTSDDKWLIIRGSKTNNF